MPDESAREEILALRSDIDKLLEDRQIIMNQIVDIVRSNGNEVNQGWEILISKEVVESSLKEPVFFVRPEDDGRVRVRVGEYANESVDGRSN